MEKAEKDYMRSRFYELSQNLKCRPELLNLFLSKRMLSAEEIEIIENKVTSSEKSQELFRFIQTKHNAFKCLLHGLQETGQTGALKILAEPSQTDDSDMKKVQRFVERWIVEQWSTPLACYSLSEKNPIKNIKFDVLQPVLSFTGRAKELEQLHEIVLRSQKKERVSVVSQVTSVSGLGGIGKTQLAREYIRIKEKEFDGNVIWMNAESEESLYDSFKRLAGEKLELPTQDRNGQMISNAVYNYCVGIKALFVFDNAEKKPWLKQFMPQIENTHNLFFLITSRDREWDRGVEILSLDGLGEDEAVDLIQQGLKIDASDPVQTELSGSLAKILQCFPLALQQAIAYIYEQRRTRSDYSVDTYLEEFKTKQLELLDYQEKNAIFYDIFSTTTATIWNMTINKIKKEPNTGRLASFILNVIAYLGADQIRRDLFYRLRLKRHWLAVEMFKIFYYYEKPNKRRRFLPIVCSIAEISLVKQEQTNAAVDLLVKYSMLSGRDGQNILSVHRLVQAVTQNQLARAGMEEIFLEIAIQILQGNDENDFPAENIGHALIVWRQAFKYNQIILRHSWRVERILWKMMKVGHHDEGLRFGNEALGKLKKVFGDDHEKVLWIQHLIGLILDVHGYVEKAILAFQSILLKVTSSYDEDSVLSLLTKKELGACLVKVGKNEKGLKILKEVLGKKKIFYGDNHFITLTTELDYGIALFHSGNCTESEETFIRIIETYIEKEYVNSTFVLLPLNNLAEICLRKGYNEIALEIHRENYGKIKPVWVQNVWLFALVFCNLGESLNKVGDYEKALEILEGNIEKIKERFGSQHFWTLNIQQEIGRSYRGLQNFSKALEIFQSVHLGFVFLSGEDSLRTLDASNDVAITLSLLGEHSQALSRFQEILEKLETLLGNENYDLLPTKRAFALALERSAADLPTALNLLKNTKAAIISIVGDDPPIVEDITNDIKRIEKKIKPKTTYLNV